MKRSFKKNPERNGGIWGNIFERIHGGIPVGYSKRICEEIPEDIRNGYSVESMKESR